MQQVCFIVVLFILVEESLSASFRLFDAFRVETKAFTVITVIIQYMCTSVTTVTLHSHHHVSDSLVVGVSRPLQKENETEKEKTFNQR